jgi:chemotaxis protein methyltransferase CheR
LSFLPWAFAMKAQGSNIERVDLEQLAALLLERAGLKITPDGYSGLRLALKARMPAAGAVDAAAYVRRLKQPEGDDELRALLPLVTVGKTEFFRDSKQFAAFENEVLPALLLEARQRLRPLKIWSAGCATGEEPYSIAMAAIDQGASAGDVDCWATDVNPAAVEKAAQGRYALRRLVGMSEPRLARHFTLHDGTYVVNDALRRMVRFDSHNLAAPTWESVAPQSLDVIFCRNVIIYFDQPTIAGVMERFFEALRPGGWLFLGYSESLFRQPTRFEMVEVKEIFVYRRPPERSRPATQPPLMSPTLTPPSLPLPRPSAPRSPALASSFPLPAQTPLTAPSKAAPLKSKVGTPMERLTEVIADIERGDFPRALRLVFRLVEDNPDDLAARITLGNVHALMGNIDEARDAFQFALAKEPLSLEARLYLGITAMQANETEAARQEFTRALFLEPTLALGHYLLAQVHERRGDIEGARRSYRNAMNQKKGPPHPLLGHFPDMPTSNDAIAQAAQYRLAALSEH